MLRAVVGKNGCYPPEKRKLWTYTFTSCYSIAATHTTFSTLRYVENVNMECVLGGCLQIHGMSAI